VSVKITAIITGARQWHQAVQMMDAATLARVRQAVSDTTLAVEARAKANVPVSGPGSRKAKNRPGPGELRDTIRSSMSTGGTVGFVLAGFGTLPRRSRATKPPKQGPMRLAAFQRQQRRLALRQQRELGVYAMVINYGSPGRGIAATHFMDNAKEAEREAHIRRVQNALAQAASAAAQGAAA